MRHEPAADDLQEKALPELETTTTSDDHRAPTEDRLEATLSWLEDEFPGWTFEITGTRTWSRDSQPLWIGRKAGHHPQAELSAAKLHTRLTEYLEREARRVAMTN